MTACPPQWIEGMNRMNINIVPSNFVKEIMSRCTFEMRDDNTQEVKGTLKNENPIEVLFEGADTEIYKPTKEFSKSLVDEMNKYDVVVTYYGTRFDIPFIRTRALYHGTYFPMYRQKSHKDLYYVVKSKLKLHRSSLMAATEFFGIAGKTRIRPEYWQKARWGDEQSLEYIYKHNVADVVILEKLHRKLEEYAAPTVNPI